MKYYHGNEHYYLTQIFIHDTELIDVFYKYSLYGLDKYELFCYSVADLIHDSLKDNKLFNSGLSANEIYQEQIKSVEQGESPSSTFLGTYIQPAILTSYDKIFSWEEAQNEELYVAILKTLIYGSIKHFFFINRKKFLPQYDWFLIEKNNRRKEIIEILFKEFDKLTNVVDAIKYYQDPDDIPDEYIVYLMELTGFSVNDNNKILSEEQIRSLTKNLINVWKHKGSLYSFELFFACMGVECQVQEMYFDRRMLFNPGKENVYTHEQSHERFAYYLTPNNPVSTSFQYYSPDLEVNVKYNSSSTIDVIDITHPISSEAWDYEINKYKKDYNGKNLDNYIKALLNYNYDEEVDGKYDYIENHFTYFKSNYVLFSFLNLDDHFPVTMNERKVYEELITKLIPVFIKYKVKVPFITVGGDTPYDWDIMRSYEPNLVNANGKVIDAGGDLIKQFVYTEGSSSREKTYELQTRGLGITDNNDFRQQLKNNIMKSTGSYGPEISEAKLYSKDDRLQQDSESIIPKTLWDESTDNVAGDPKNKITGVEKFFSYTEDDDGTRTYYTYSTIGKSTLIQHGDEDKEGKLKIRKKDNNKEYYFVADGSETRILPLLIVDEGIEKDLKEVANYFEGMEINDSSNDIRCTFSDTGEHLFEDVTFKTNVQCSSNLYNNSEFVGEVRYSIYNPSIPLVSIESNLEDEELTLSII